jgi:hypothetical protein
MSMALSFFWLSPLAARMRPSASSEAFEAAARACRRDSPVAGGTVMWRVVGVSGFGPWGVRFSFEFRMVVFIGFTCWVMLDGCLDGTRSIETYIFLMAYHVDIPPLRNNLCQVFQLDCRNLSAITLLSHLHLQFLELLRIEPPSSTELRQLVCELLSGFEDFGLESGEVKGIGLIGGPAGAVDWWWRRGRFSLVGFLEEDSAGREGAS